MIKRKRVKLALVLGMFFLLFSLSSSLSKQEIQVVSQDSGSHIYGNYSNSLEGLIIEERGGVAFFGPYDYSFIVSERGRSGQLSNSMYPIISPRNNVFCKIQNFEDIKIGQLIIFKSGQEYVGHMVVERKYNGFITKGINNEFKDNLVVSKNRYKCTIMAVVFT